ncbi:hypothetical protein [Sphingobacterium thalpophilum]|uniref:hypothetical protein n=1 Tax=Sphingobacterium thalpophilum TaxID=259 RepID=UPI002D76FF89|nr:hypothetical protein [Sphingobacterium thalpophilum]
MKKLLSILLLTSVLFGSCTKNNKHETAKIRFMFDAGDLQFISSSFNPDQQTMSALYGNQQAIKLLTGSNKRLPGSALKQATYKVQDDPNYFGSKVNGELLRVETLETDAKGNLRYHIEFGSISSDESQQQRMAHILDQEPIEFPQ